MDAFQSQRLRTTFFNNVFPLLPFQKMNERIKDIYVLFTATNKEESKIMMRIKKVYWRVK